MGDYVEIVAPTENVNDPSVVVYEFLVEDGAEVKEGQDVIAVETSKATTNIEATADGYIKFVVSIGDEIPNGELLAVIGNDREQIDKYCEVKEEKKAAPKQNTKDNNSSTIHVESFLAEVSPFGIFDTSVTLGEIYIKSGVKVDEGTILCKVRNGKTIEEIKAPKAGYVHWNIEPYKTVSKGQEIGTISGSPIAPTNVVTDNTHYNSLRISREAKRILDEKKLTAEALGLSGLVTTGMIEEVLNPKKVEEKKPFSITTEKKKVFHSTSGRIEKLSKAKRAEASFLSDANREAIVSQVSVLVPTQGIFSACEENPELASRFSSTLIFEVGKLLKGYRHMTAIYDDGQLLVYDHINIGYALAIDDGLKVPVFRDADQMDLETIMMQKNAFIEKYVSRELSPDDLGGGTFTITDLSSTGCYLFNPILNLGQSVILGIGGENPDKTNYPLILAFDHRVIDGETATEFLNKLKERLISHENVLLGKEEKETEESPRSDLQNVDVDNLCCDSCFRSAEEIEELGHYLFKVIDKSGNEKHICSICMRGW